MTGSGGAWIPRHRWWCQVFGLGAIGFLGYAVAVLPVDRLTLLVVCSIAVLITLIRPVGGLLLLIPAIPFGSVYQVSIGPANLGVTEALVGLVALAWFMKLAANRHGCLVLPRLVLPMMMLLGALMLTFLNAASLELSLKEALKWFEVVLIYVLVANELNGRWSAALVLMFLLTGTAVAVQGIYQFVTQSGPEGFILFGRFMRAHGSFGQPNPYAGYLALLIPMAVGIAVAYVFPFGRRPGWGWLAVALLSGSLMLLAVVMSWSRGAWLGLAAGLAAIALAVLARGGSAAVVVTACAAFIAWLLGLTGALRVPASIGQRFVDSVPYLGHVDVRGVEITDANYAVLERLAHWQAAVDMWKEHLWLGVGAGNYAVAYEQYSLPLWREPLGHAHNYYLNIAAEGGIVGLSAYLLFWILASLESWLAIRRASGWQLGVSLGVLGAVVHLAVHSFFDNLYVHGIYLQVALLLGVTAFLTHEVKKAHATPHGA